MTISISNKIKAKYPELTAKQHRLVVKKVQERLKSGRGVGNGFFSDLVSKVKQGAKNLAGKAVETGLNVVQKVANVACTHPDPKYEVKLYPGEKHQVFLKDGCAYRGRFAGPGTRAIEHLKELLAMNGGNLSLALADKNFVSLVDKESAAHDFRYLLSDGSKEKVREADQKFINVLSKMSDPQRLIPLAAMKAKVLAENYKITGVYGVQMEKLNEADKKLLEDALSHLEQQGFGRHGAGAYSVEHDYMLGPIDYKANSEYNTVPDQYKTGPVGYPKLGDSPAYPPEGEKYFNAFSYPRPELGFDKHPRPNRPPKTESYSVPVKYDANGLHIKHGNGQYFDYLYPTPEQRAGLMITDEDGPYVQSGVPLKYNGPYDPNIPPLTQPYSVPIKMVSARKSYNGKGKVNQVDQINQPVINGGYDQINPLLNGRGKPRKRRSAGGSVWVDFVKGVQAAHPGMSYKEAMIEAKKTYKKK